MEKYAVWFGLLLKKNIKKKTVYIQSAVLIILLVFIQLIYIPEKDNTKIGICLNDSNIAEDIYDDLTEQTETYDFVEYRNLEQLEKAVVSGKVECGFYFSEDFDDDFEEGKIRDLVKFFVTPMSAKAELIRENFYISFLKEYSEVLLLQSEEELYGEISEDRTEQILSLNGQYLEGDEVFELDIHYVETVKKEAKNEKQTLYMQGIYGLFVFMFMFLSYHKGNGNKTDFRSVLNKKDGIFYDILELVSVALIPAICGMFVLIFSEKSRGIFIEIIATFVLLILSTLWMLVFSVFCKNEANYLSMFLLVLIAQVIVCPIFWDLSGYSKFLEYIRYLFPLGTYLLL